MLRPEQVGSAPTRAPALRPPRPLAGEKHTTNQPGRAGLNTGGGTRDGLGPGPDDFAVIYAYPWPDAEGLSTGLVERYGAEGAVSVPRHGSGDFRPRQKRG
jgi:hypothetical protein